MANITGKRYVCAVCGTEFIVTKGGTGTLQCHGRPMVPKESAPTPTGTTPDEKMGRSASS